MVVSNFSIKKLNIASADIIWPAYRRLELSLAIALLTVPPMPSHALLPYAVAKKCHSHANLEVRGVVCDVDEIELVFVLACTASSDFCTAPVSVPVLQG